MRWQPFAREVIDGLQRLHLLSPIQAPAILEHIASGQGEEAFQQCFQILSETPYRVGWNKIWRSEDLIGWYGRELVTQPLRLAALEIGADEDQWSRTRRLLAEDLSERANVTITPESQAIRMNLGSLGIFGQGEVRNHRSLKLLQRLNLDLRTRPFVERWRWTKRSGFAITSDDDRLQISQHLPWARALEAVIVTQGQIPEHLMRFLEKVTSGSLEVETTGTILGESWDVFIRILNFYGLAQPGQDRIRFATQPGTFAKLALRLWGPTPIRCTRP